MRAVDIITKTRDKEELSSEEFHFLIENFTSGEIPDYQMAAWAMAVLLNGMTDQEITDLTLAMAASGDQLDLSEFGGNVVDKHSTGGVGDKTTLVVAPIVAACGLPVGKMSGRGLGFSGGTIDKLESIPGFKTDLTTEEFIDQLKNHGIVLTGQSADLAPADGKLYSLRDVTGTVQSIPLIASSVMSKKIAAGADAIALDVKVGRGAFMKTLEEARALAEVMVSIGKLSGRRVIALLSQMDQPLGVAVGNALELKEAIEMLHGQGPEDFHVHCVDLSAYMLLLGNKTDSLDSARQMAQKAIDDGSAWEKFRELVIIQHGDVSFIDQPEKLPQASFVFTVVAEKDGWVSVVDAKEVGESSVVIGAGRAKKGDQIDPAVGIMVRAKIGDKITKGQAVFDVHVNDESAFDTVLEKLKNAVEISDEPVDPPPYFWDVLGIE
ncbi:MAG: pyrimidine-nucleoside phosphorylase [Anaerolineaceae bacterium]|nr:pyrimidine-nucleoside phosphorylase [Anaerolineaceae bacterium]